MSRGRAILHAHVWVFTFTVALVFGAALHLMLLPMGARLVVANVNRVLAPVFAGHLIIDGVHRIGFTGTVGLDAHADSDEGQPVLTLQGIDVRISTLMLLRSLAKGSAPIVIDIPSVSIARADVALDPDQTGTPRIAAAFRPRSPAPSTKPGREVRLALPYVHVARAVIHGPFGASDEADLDDADASLLYTSAGLAIDVGAGRLGIRGLPGGEQARGSARGHFEKPTAGEMVVRASWDGSVGAIAERADVALHGQELDASLDVSPVGRAEVCALWPGWPIAAVCAAHIEAHGTLPRIVVSAHASVGAGTVDLSGPITVGPVVQAALHVDIRGFDGQALATPVPCADIDLAGDVSLATRPTGETDGHAAFALSDAECGANRVPPVGVTGDFARSAEGELTGHAELAIREAGAPTLVSLQAHGQAGAMHIAFDGTSRATRLEDVPRLKGLVSGSADLRVTGQADLGGQTIDAQVTASGAGLRSHGVSIGNARLEAHAAGKLQAPVIDVLLDAEAIGARAVTLSAARAQGRVTLAGGPVLHDIRVDFAGDDAAPIHARAALVSLLGGRARVDAAVVEGLGDPISGELVASPGALAVRAKSTGIDLERVASFVAIPVRAGRLSLDLDATVSAGAAEGKFEVDLTRGAVGDLKNVSAHVDAVLHGRRAYGRATAAADDIGTVEVQSNSVEVGEGALLTARPWRRAWGAVNLEAHADLAKLAAHLPAAAMPLESVQGKLEITARLARESALDMTPEVEVHARTAGLALAGKRGSARWHVEGVDPFIHVAVNGETGATKVDAQLSDATGPFATLSASSSSVPYEAIFSDSGVTTALEAMPFDAELEVPPRRLDSLPPALGFGGRRGTLEGKVTWHGAVAQPEVDLVATLVRGARDPNLVALPVDVSVTGHYDGQRATLSLGGEQKGTRVLDASAEVAFRTRDWLSGVSPMPWVASATATLDRLPLKSFDVLDDRQVAGTVSGRLSLDGLHEDARASAVLDFGALQVGDVACKAGHIEGGFDGQTLNVQGSLDQADGGTIHAQLQTGARWGRAIVPAVDASKLIVANLKAKQFRAGLLRPFWPQQLTELDGRIDADARVEIDAAHQTARPNGTISIRDATFELASMGTEFHGAAARLTLTPDGIVRLQDVVALGTSGRVTASATAWLAGLSLGGGSASLRIAPDEPLPLVFDGVQMGKLDGHFDATMKRTNQETDVEVNVPSMTLELPSGSASRDVQSLGEIEGVRIGRAQSSEFVEEELDAVDTDDAEEQPGATPRPMREPIVIDVRLGSDVEVKKGEDLDVRLEGQPKVTMAARLQVSGQVRLQRGTISVQGKRFEIENGTVTFVGDDASNPQVVLTAVWSAADGTRIYADFVGPLKTGKVTLRSEPARPQNEILALILFGTVDDQGSAGANPQASMAASQAGGVATQPLNQALGGMNHALDKLGLAGGISTKIDTSTANPRPEVEVQIARDISLQVAWVLGAIPPGTNPDTALLTLDWHFLRKWALETTVGDSGTSIVDVVWQHRY